MVRRLGIATVCLSGTLADKLAAAAAAGFASVEIFENDLVVAASTSEEIRARCADLGLSIDPVPYAGRVGHRRRVRAERQATQTAADPVGPVCDGGGRGTP